MIKFTKTGDRKHTLVFDAFAQVHFSKGDVITYTAGRWWQTKYVITDMTSTSITIEWEWTLESWFGPAVLASMLALSALAFFAVKAIT